MLYMVPLVRRGVCQFLQTTSNCVASFQSSRSSSSADAYMHRPVSEPENLLLYGPRSRRRVPLDPSVDFVKNVCYPSSQPRTATLLKLAPCHICNKQRSPKARFSKIARLSSPAFTASTTNSILSHRRILSILSSIKGFQYPQNDLPSIIIVFPQPQRLLRHRERTSKRSSSYRVLGLAQRANG